jgi:hypothetical protein
VLAVKVRGWNSCDEKLAAVSVGARVGHAEQPGADVLVLEVFVSEFGTVDALAPGAVVVGEVAALQKTSQRCAWRQPPNAAPHLKHKPRNDSVKDTTAHREEQERLIGKKTHLPL